jgi:hypothetical protein
LREVGTDDVKRVAHQPPDEERGGQRSSGTSRRPAASKSCTDGTDDGANSVRPRTEPTPVAAHRVTGGAGVGQPLRAQSVPEAACYERQARPPCACTDCADDHQCDRAETPSQLEEYEHRPGGRGRTRYRPASFSPSTCRGVVQQYGPRPNG